MKTTPDASPNIILAYLIAALLGIAMTLPAWIWGVPWGADLDNHFRFALPFFDEISSGNVMPGWLAESNNGFGDARFRFYPPLIYYVLAAGRMLTGEWYFATLLTFSLFSVIGTAGVYAWTRQNFPSRVAVVAALLFALMPYHFVQFYQASLLAEFAAISFLPYAFLFVERITASRGRKLAFSIVGLGLSFGLIVLTHIPTIIVGALSLGLFTLLSTDWKRNKKALLYAALGIGLALILSSFYWGKMVTELSWIQGTPAIPPPHYDYRNNFLFSPFALVNLNSWFGSLIAALTIAIFLPATILLRVRTGNDSDGGSQRPSEIQHEIETHEPIATNRPLRPAVIVALFGLLMTTDLSRPIWAVIPKLQDIQFPFRWLTVVTVLICPVVAVSLYAWLERLRQKKAKAWQLPVLLAFVIAVAYSIYEFALSSEFKPRQQFVEHIQAVRGGPSFSAWLPVGAAEVKDLRPMTGPIDPQGREVLSTHITSHHRRFTLAPGTATEIRIRSYYYPHWQATVTTATGTVKAETKKAEDGTLLVAVPAESCEVSVQFADR